MVIGIRRSSARSDAAKSPPMAEPPMPASVMLRTSAYAGGMVAPFASCHASRTCLERSLMRSSMLPGSAARILSTDSITDVSSSGTLHHPLPRVEHRLHLVLPARLGIDAHERLGPREAYEQPRYVVQEELHGITRIQLHDLRDGVAGEIGWLLCRETLHDRDLLLRIGGRVQMQVAAQIEGRADHVHQLGDELARLFLGLMHEVEEEQVGDDPVTLGQVHREAEAAGLLPAHHGACLDHLRRD